MPKLLLYIILGVIGVACGACTHRSSKVEQMRIQKQLRDSVNYMQAQQNFRYSDSLLQVLLPQVDPLIKKFVYQKDEKAQDHGQYVHRLLQTTANVSRNFLQAYVTDNRQISLQSYYCGSTKHMQRAIRLNVGEDYVEKEGSNHIFQAEGWHEILTIQGEDAAQLLAFVAGHSDERIYVKSVGDKSSEYVLSSQEKLALSETYQLWVLMRDIDALERAMHVADLQIQKYEKKHVNCK